MANNWNEAWYRGDFEAIFRSPAFKSTNAYEDAPWFLPEFYKFLFHRFPGAKFILFTRDPDAWYASMVKHSRGSVLGKTKIHCKVYRREQEYNELVDRRAIDESNENQWGTEKALKLAGFEEHYKKLYALHAREVQEFFQACSPQSLFVGQLRDHDKWQKLGQFLGIQVPSDYECHENASAKLAPSA